MSKTRDEYLDNMFGVKGVAELLKEGPQKLAEKLAEAGIQHKSVDQPTAQEAVTTAKENFSALLMQMINDLADTRMEFDKLAETTSQKDMQRDGLFQTLEQQLKALSEDNTKLRAEMANSPRASQAKATIVTDEQAKKDIDSKTMSYDPRWPGMQVPLGK